MTYKKRNVQVANETKQPNVIFWLIVLGIVILTMNYWGTWLNDWLVQ